MRYRLNKWVDEVEGFNGAQWGGNEVKETAITGRTISIAIPKGSMTEEQRAVFDEVRERARNLRRPVDIVVTEF